MSVILDIKSTISAIWATLEMFFITPILPPKLSTSVESLDIQGKRILVTGSNAGIGKETARYFAAHGAEVFLLCRNEATALVARDELRRGTGNPKIFVEVVDMSSLESVRGFLNRWTERSPESRMIDILMNNAGRPANSTKVTTSDGFELLYETNFLTQFLLTSSLLTLGLLSHDARIVQTSSIMMYSSGKLNPADPNSSDLLGRFQEGDLLPMSSAETLYVRSKVAQVVWTRELQERLARTERWEGVIVQSCNPGWVSTDIWHKPGSLSSHPVIYRLACVVDKIIGLTAAQGAVMPIYLATSPEAAQPAVRGGYWDLRRRWTPGWMEDDDRRKQLWTRWEQDSGINASF